MIYVLDPTSNDFKVDEAKICTDMGSKLWSLTNCYVDERTCNDLGSGVSYPLYDKTWVVCGSFDVQNQPIRRDGQ